MQKTEFFTDFLTYYCKADTLEQKNLLKHNVAAGDLIMDNVTIYDTVHRRQAGFSKALEDIHGVRQRKDLVRYADFSKRIDSTIFQFLHLFHRFTGSGASFEPTFKPDGSRNPREHGYCNNLVEELAGLASIRGEQAIACMRELITTMNRPMVTSKGNQPPSLKNPDPSKYRLAMQYYFDNFAESFVNAYITFLLNREYQSNKPTGIKDAVNYCLLWHKANGFKQWHFVLTAFVMDTAEYYPELVDPESHCYYGANCVKAFELMFEKEKSDPKNKAEYQELCMTTICEMVKGRPYDVEDIACDYIRYVKEYIPKGYEHLTPEQRLNNSTLKINGEYPEWVKLRMQRILE